LAATKPLPPVQKAAGHASIRTTMGYVHLADDDLSVLVEQAPRAKAGRIALQRHESEMGRGV
jgi:site-specific recombinase XerC